MARYWCQWELMSVLQAGLARGTSLPLEGFTPASRPGKFCALPENREMQYRTHQRTALHNKAKFMHRAEKRLLVTATLANFGGPTSPFRLVASVDEAARSMLGALAWLTAS